jgi:hypothetical protein
MYRPQILGTLRTSPPWLPLAAMAKFFTQKSHAAPCFTRNSLITLAGHRVRDIFDSHRPLHSHATPGHCRIRSSSEVPTTHWLVLAYRPTPTISTRLQPIL